MEEAAAPKVTICGESYSTALRELRLEEAEFDRNRDMVIQLGDMIDRGPDPCGVLEFFKAMKEKIGDRCVLLRGNHEEILMEAVKDRELMDLWSFNGGMKTVRSMKTRGMRPADWVSWLESETVLWYQDEEEMTPEKMAACMSELGF